MANHILRVLGMSAFGAVLGYMALGLFLLAVGLRALGRIEDAASEGRYSE